MPRLKLVVVGNGMAGIRTVEELLAIAPDLYEITVFGAEPHPNYNRVLLSPVLAGEQTLEQIVLNPLAWYAGHGIGLHAGVRVTAIDRRRRVVRAESDGGAVIEAGYDRLLLATGSQPVLLPVPGHGLRGVLAYRDIADTQAMIDAARPGRSAVVIGGGLLGLEAANGLARRGMAVTVVHLAAWLMDRQLDAPAAALLQQALARRGLRFVLGAQTEALLSDGAGRVCAVRLQDGGDIPADLVVMAAGIRPRTELAQRSGLHCVRGIAVSDTLQTLTDPRIYAVGECASHRGVAYGLVAPLFEQARVCASHLAGHGLRRYVGSRVSTRLKVTGIDVFSAGDFQGGAGCEDLLLTDPVGGVYKRLVLKDDRLVGAVLVGDTAEASLCLDLLHSGRALPSDRDTLLFGHPGGAAVPGHTSPSATAPVPAPVALPARPARRRAHAPAAA